MLNELLNKFSAQLTQAAPKITTGLILFVCFWIASIILEKVIILIGRKSRVEVNIIFLLARIARTALILLGGISGLGTMGINISALVASLGLTGFALGFALKDALSNVLAGVLILIYKPFRIGSKIKVMGYEGEVTQIDLRYTQLKTQPKEVLIPNSNLFNNPIEILLQ